MIMSPPPNAEASKSGYTTQLRPTEARNKFWYSSDVNQREIVLSLISVSMAQKWDSISSALYKESAQIMSTFSSHTPQK